jgi:hypothetical protein
MSFDPRDAFIGGASSNCCGASVLIGDICAECKEHCEAEDEDGPTDEQQELARAGAEVSDARYRQQMQDAGRGHLLP